jgi:hypothetical protein
MLFDFQINLAAKKLAHRSKRNVDQSEITQGNQIHIMTPITQKVSGFIELKYTGILDMLTNQTHILQ